MSKRNYRRNLSGSSSDETEEPELRNVLDDVKELQKLRKRPAGLNISELAQSQSSYSDSKQMNNDPLNLKHGGMLDMKKLKTVDLKNVDIEEGIRQTFSKESHLRDEDEEMRKYVEEELSRRKGQKQETSSSVQQSSSGTADDGLYELPDNLKKYQSKRTENMLSNQMLCGIPEVDLGIEAKIRNIEETEAAKLKLLKEAIEKKRSLTEKLTSRQNLSKNLAKQYVQHNIYNIQETTKIGSEVRTPLKRPYTQPVPVVDEDTPKWIQDGRTVERPSNVQQQKPVFEQKHKRPNTAKPTDKEVMDKFRTKFVKKKN